MTTLAEKRKDAIKAHEVKTRTSILELETMAQAMRVVGLNDGALKIENIARTLTYDLMTLMTSASVNKST